MQWETIYLYYYASCSIEEIARLQSCSVSNVYKTLRTARQSIKDYLEGKRKKKPFKGALPISLGLASLALLFVVEEQVFAAVYIPLAAPCWAAAGTATAALGAATVSAAAPAVGYITAACAVVAVALSAVVYYSMAFESLPDNAVAMQPPTTAMVTEAPTLPPTAHPTPSPIPYIATIQVPEAEPEPEPVTDPPPLVSPPTTAPPTLPPPTLPPTTFPPATLPPPTMPPPPPDRTVQIMAALAQANSSDAVARIIQDYGFTQVEYIRGDGERFRFYTTNEGSGDIFIGNATCDNGIWQRMHHALFNHSAVPTDIIDLIIFMERN